MGTAAFRSGTLVWLAATIASAAAAADQPDHPPKLNAEISQTLQTEFKYAPPLPDATVLPAPPTAVEEPVIAMPKFTVLSSRINMRELERQIDRNRAQAVAAKPKWGCGPVIQKDWRKVRLTVVSIFYVPVYFGLSW